MVGRFTPDQWRTEGAYSVIEHRLDDVRQPTYLRVRGTNNADELEPEPDGDNEDPWGDLWFYSNPVFISLTP